MQDKKHVGLVYVKIFQRVEDGEVGHDRFEQQVLVVVGQRVLHKHTGTERHTEKRERERERERERNEVKMEQRVSNAKGSKQGDA